MSDPERPARAAGPPGGFGVMDAVELIRRRWVVVVGAAAVVTGISWWQLRRDVPHYTAQVLLQRHRDDMLVIGGLPTAGARQVLASEIEILRSRSVLAPVVDSLGLRFFLEDASVGRSALFGSVQISPEAPTGLYVLTHRSDSTIVRTSGGTPVARGARGEPVAGPGFRLRSQLGLPEGAVRFTILDREEAGRQLRGAMTVEQVEGTNLIRIRYTTTDPQLAAAVANELAAAYQRHSAAQSRAEGARQREFITEQLTSLADSMSAAQAALLDYQRRSRTLDPQLEGQAVASALLDAQTVVRTLRFQESLLTTVLLSLRSGGTDNDAFRRLVALGNDGLPGGEALYNRLQALETERQRLTASRYGYTDQGPQVEVLDSLIAATKNEARGITEESLTLLRTRRSAVEARQRELQQRVRELPEQAMTFQRLQQRVDAVQRIVDLLVEKFYEALIPEAGGTGGVEVVDAATVPAGPDPLPGRSRLFFGLLVGLALGVGSAFGLEQLDSTVRYPWDAESAAGLPIVGMVPNVRATGAAADRPLPVTFGDNGPEAESFRMIRTTLRFVRAERPRVLAVTSAGPGEGKTLIATNLALAMRQQTPRVLLVDGDLRNPLVHRTLQVEREPGLTDLLVKEVGPDIAIRFVAANGLGVLPAGTATLNPAELLGSDAFASFLDYAREHFDTVIIDTPPVLSAADAAVVAPSADGVLLVACVNRTNRMALKNAVDHLNMVKGSLLGVILNRVPAGGPFRRYSYAYGAYGGSPGEVLRPFTRLLRRG